MLHSLSKEVTDMQENKEEQLLFQMDRLYENSSKLNKKLYRIVRELESEAKLKMEIGGLLWAVSILFVRFSSCPPPFQLSPYCCMSSYTVT